MSYENALVDILKRRNPELFGRLLKIQEVAKSLLSYTQGKFPYYTPHGFSHSLAVEENLNWLLPDDLKDSINSNEIFFLIVAAWMHDWGMVGKPEEDPEQIRESHHLRTERFFEELHDKLFLTEHEGRIIGRISKGHTKENLFSTDYDDEVFGSSIRIRRRFLAAVLRIADECDISHNRTPEVIFYSLSPKGKAEEEFKKHLSISGVGQLDEKHKIYISAIARDPKGAKALRMVRDKVQEELNAVKTILGNNGISLDTVELRIETRGFVDKPIGIEVDKKKIVDLLMGEHLYSCRDVAIRGLVQNAIDGCRAKLQTQNNIECKIVLTKPDENTIIVEDNGLGMDFSIAKKYLSVIGNSYYSSEEFSKFVEKSKFEPIALFGIGILSSFLISDGLTIETKKDGHEPCRFSINEVEEDWKYEKGELTDSGTKITLRLNDYGKSLNIQETLQRYFVDPSIDIYFQDNTSTLKKFERIWFADKIIERFDEDKDRPQKILVKEIVRLETDNYQLIFATTSNYNGGAIFLFNQGIFVQKVEILGLNNRYFLCVNTKKKLYDLQVSREHVVRNEKMNKFLHSLFNEFFDYIFKMVKGNEKEYIEFVAGLMEVRWVRFIIKPEETLEAAPFIRSILDRALFPIVSEEGKLSFSRLDELPKIDDYSIYFAHTNEPLKEIEIVLEVRGTKIIINPYCFPLIQAKNQQEDAVELLTFMLKRKANLLSLDLNRILVENSREVTANYKDIIPDNVKLANFTNNLKPIAVIKKQAQVQRSPYLGANYWGNILLWKKLIPSEILLQNVNELGSRGIALESVKLISEHVALIDAKDQFVQKVIDKRTKGVFDEKITKKVLRYFTYLSYLPLVLSDIVSSIIFFEVIYDLEKEITESLHFSPSEQIINRFNPNLKIYQEFCQNCDKELFYIEK